MQTTVLPRKKQCSKKVSTMRHEWVSKNKRLTKQSNKVVRKCLEIMFDKFVSYIFIYKHRKIHITIGFCDALVSSFKPKLNSFSVFKFSTTLLMTITLEY